jgi:hypothetical protein
MEDLITTHLNWLKSQTLITKCKWTFSEGVVIFKLYRGEWIWLSNSL